MILVQTDEDTYNPVVDTKDKIRIAIFDSIRSAEICIDDDVKKPSMIIPLEGIPYGFKEKIKAYKIIRR
jgi:hypothetical protein